MEQPTLSPAKKPESKGATIFKALLEWQKFISNHLQIGGNIKALKQMGLRFGKIDLQDDVPVRN